jgi:hypothetical protein
MIIMINKLHRQTTHPDHNVINFHVALHRGIAPLYQPFDHNLWVGIGSTCAAHEGDPDT